ncbi:MAG: hypothetical protein NZ897_04935 [Gemmatales bacterium]|nr:hypothetical protein [Gemmatales bacterium]
MGRYLGAQLVEAGAGVVALQERPLLHQPLEETVGKVAMPMQRGERAGQQVTRQKPMLPRPQVAAVAEVMVQ